MHILRNLTTKWKMPKKVVGGLVVAISFHFLGFATPVLAQDVVRSVSDNTPEVTTLSNGAILSDIERELVQKNLVILEKEPVSMVVEPTYSIAGVVEPEPLDIQQAANVVGGAFMSWGVRTITSYNSEPGQTDDSPCITANGFNVCEHGIEDTIAANFLKFGTKVTIPDLFGERVFVVRDRMNQRYPDRVDVWMIHKADAKVFGVRRAEINVLVE